MNVTEVVVALIGLCSALLTAVVAPWIKSKIGNERMEEFLAWVEIAVAAAEQLYESTDGEKKKEFVLRFLSEKGYEVSEKEVDSAIESAVLALHHALYGVKNENIKE